MDFGIARSTSHATSTEREKRTRPARSPSCGGRRQLLSDQTLEGAVVGTVEYMAPEQAQGKPVDQRADIYALGLIVYDMLGGLGGRRDRDSAISELTARMQEAPPPIRTINPEVPEALEKVIVALPRARPGRPLPDDEGSRGGPAAAGRTRAACCRCCAGSPAASWRRGGPCAVAARRHVVDGARARSGRRAAADLRPDQRFRQPRRRRGLRGMLSSRRSGPHWKARRSSPSIHAARRSRLPRRSARARASTKRWRDSSRAARASRWS